VSLSIAVASHSLHIPAVAYQLLCQSNDNSGSV